MRRQHLQASIEWQVSSTRIHAFQRPQRESEDKGEGLAREKGLDRTSIPLLWIEGSQAPQTTIRVEGWPMHLEPKNSLTLLFLPRTDFPI